jgi:hypothetical protein
MNTEQTDVMKARLEKLKATKIAIVSSDADHTDVKFDPEDATAGGLRQQLQGFFQIFWSMSYGRLLAVKPGDHFELTTVPEGYVVKSTAGATKVVINMDEKYRITGTTVESPQMSAEATPGFVAGEDGLLRLRRFDETIIFGESKVVIKVNLDYQRVGVYDIPQHVQMAVPGSYSFDYALSGCEVKEAKVDAAAAPASKN